MSVLTYVYVIIHIYILWNQLITFNIIKGGEDLYIVCVFLIPRSVCV